MKKWSLKKSLEKSQNVLEQKRKNGQAQILQKKTNTFTILASDFVREQSNTISIAFRFMQSLQKLFK